MKTLSRISLLVWSLALCLPLIDAADTSASAPANPTAQPSRDNRALGRPGMMHRRQAIARRIAHHLGLNPTQIAQIKTIRSGARASVSDIRANPSLTPEQKKAQIRDLLASTRTQMRAVLTPDQLTKLEELKCQAWQRMGGF